MHLQRLEPCGSKDPCTVLRGLDAGNRTQLPDSAVDISKNPKALRHHLVEMAAPTEAGAPKNAAVSAGCVADHAPDSSAPAPGTIGSSLR
jgi:hypothetical protein